MVCPEIFFICFIVCPYALKMVRLALDRLPDVWMVAEEVKGFGKIENVFSFTCVRPKVVCPA